MKLSTLLGLGLVCSLAPSATRAQPLIDPSASVIELRSSCAMPGSTYLDNCFETTADVVDWLWNGGRTSEPNSLDPVTVRVAPGTFDRFECDGTSVSMRGFVSVVGSGRDVTRFVNPIDAPEAGLGGACPGGITVRDCTSLSFRHVTAQGLGSGVVWAGAGSSQWEGLDMIADNEGAARCNGSAFGWYDLNPASLHFFWNTRFEARGVGNTGVIAFNARGESWLYGSDLFAQVGGAGQGGVYAAVLSASPNGVRIFGSTVRARADASFPTTVSGFHVWGSGATVHMHGGIVNVNAPISVSISALGPDVFVHTPGTAFVLPTSPVVSATRVIDVTGSNVQSPFLWPSSTTPPSVTNLKDGADLFVKTNEGPNQDESHLFVYDRSCTVNPWRSVTTGMCL